MYATLCVYYNRTHSITEDILYEEGTCEDVPFFFYFYSTWNFSSSIYCSPPVRERVGISTSKAWSKSSWPPLSVRPCGTRSSFSNTRGTKPLPVRPNHRPALLRVRDPKPIPPQPPWYNGRAGIIPFRYSPDLLGWKGTSHVGLDV